MIRSSFLVMLVVALAGCAGSGDPAKEIERARAAIAAGDSGEARIRLKKALGADGSLSEARLLLATIALDEGDVRTAETELSTLGPAVLSTPEGAALGIRIALAKNDLKLAGQRLDESGLLLPPKQLAFLKANLLRRRNESAEALLVLREAQRQLPDDDDIGLEIADTIAAAGQLGLAAEALSSLIDRNSPVKADALRLRAQLRLRQGSPKQAIEDFKAALSSAPKTWPRVNRISTELMLADSMLAAGQLPEAHKQLQHINDAWPGLTGAHVLAAQIDFAEGRAAQAAERLAPIVQTSPDNRRLQYLLVDALAKSGRTDKAIAVLEQLVDKDSTDSQARTMLASLYLKNGRPDRVVQLLGGGPETDLSNQNAQGKLLASARQMQQQAATRMSEIAAQLRASPDDPKLKALMAQARVLTGDIDGALSLLGPVHKGQWIAEEAGARMSALLAKGDEIAANKLVDELVNRTPVPTADVLVAAAQAAYRYQNPAVAGRLLDRAAVMKPGDSQIALQRATLAFEEKRYDDAEKRLHEIRKDDPAAVDVAAALAHVAEAKGDVDGARKQLLAAVAKFPDSMETAMMLSALEFRANRPAEANAVLDKFLSGKKDGVAANAAGNLLVRLGRMEEARSRYRQAVDAEPGNAAYWVSLAQSQLALADREAARESLLKSLELQPDSLPVAGAAVRLSLEKNDSATATRVALATTRLLPGESSSWLLRGNAELAGGQPAEAARSFARAWALQPSAAAAIGEYQALVRGKASNVDAPLLKWLAREPTDIQTRRGLADYYMATGQSAAAEKQLEIVVKAAPNDVVTLNNLAWLLTARQPDRAEKYAKQAAAIAPDNASVIDTLGMVQSGLGKHAEAEAALTRAASLAPSDQNIQYHLALVLRRAGKPSEARAPLRRALENAGKFEERENALRLQKEIGQ
jgi:cellulose synthase operon protein C